MDIHHMEVDKVATLEQHPLHPISLAILHILRTLHHRDSMGKATNPPASTHIQAHPRTNNMVNSPLIKTNSHSMAPILRINSMILMLRKAKDNRTNSTTHPPDLEPIRVHPSSTMLLSIPEIFHSHNTVHISAVRILVVCTEIVLLLRGLPRGLLKDLLKDNTRLPDMGGPHATDQWRGNMNDVYRIGPILDRIVLSTFLRY